MAVSCSFKAIVGSPCSHDRRDQSKSVSIVLCKRHRKSQVALVFYRGNLRARTHSSKSGYFHYAKGYKQSNYLSLSSVGAWPCRERPENMQGKKQLQNSGCYKSKKVSMFMSFIPFYYIDTSVLLENIEIYHS